MPAVDHTPCRRRACVTQAAEDEASRIARGPVSDLASINVTEGERKGLARIPTDDLEAYDHYLRAESLDLDGAGVAEWPKPG